MNEFEKALQLLRLAQQIQAGTIPVEGDETRNDAESAWIDEFMDAWPLALLMGQRIRLDASTTAILEQELEHLLAQTFDIVYPALQAAQLFPVDTSVPAGAEVIAYAQYDETGHAKVIHGLADDVPLVNVVKRKFSQGVVSLAAGYQIGFQQIRSALFAGTPLQDLQTGAARRAIEWLRDDIAWNGIPELNIDGFLTAAAIPATTPDTGDWTTVATPAQIEADFAKFWGEFNTANRSTARMTHVGLGPRLYDWIATTQHDVFGTKTIKTWLLDNYREEGLQQIVRVEKLRGVMAGGHDAVIGFEKNPQNLAIVEPMGFTMHPPQASGLKYLVPCEARSAGLRIPYPLRARRMGGC